MDSLMKMSEKPMDTNGCTSQQFWTQFIVELGNNGSYRISYTPSKSDRNFYIYPDIPAREVSV